MEIFNKICCNCCGKTNKEEEMEESVLMIEDFISTTKLVEIEATEEPKPEIPRAEEDKKNLPTRKHIKIKKKPIQKIDIGGAVAALPPPPIEEIEGNIPKVDDSYHKLTLGGGVYLIYSLEGNGSIHLQYTNQRPECMDGVLGYIRPNRDILSFHYENNGGKHLMTTNVCEYMKSKFQHDRKKYYGVWQEFLQLLNSYGGSLYLLSSFNLTPPPKVKLVLYSGQSEGGKHENSAAGGSGGGVLSEIGTCREIKFNHNELVGVLPSSLDYMSKLINGVNRVDFIKLCEKYGYLFESTHPPT